MNTSQEGAAMATTTARKPKSEDTGPQGTHERGDLHLPTVHVPYVPVPSPHVGLPTGTKGRVLWWGGLAAVAAFGVVDWPVVGLIAAGEWVAEQYAKSAADQAHGSETDKTEV